MVISSDLDKPVKRELPVLIISNFSLSKRCPIIGINTMIMETINHTHQTTSIL